MTTYWSPALAIGVPEIDQQHQELFLRIEKLIAGVGRGREEEIEQLVDFLGQYVVRHFGAEERWMIRSAYPAYAGHKREHEKFVRDYEQMTREFRQKGAQVLLGMRMNDWISAWLQDHIRRSDMELGRYLAVRMSPEDLGSLH